MKSRLTGRMETDSSDVLLIGRRALVFSKKSWSRAGAVDWVADWKSGVATGWVGIPGSIKLSDASKIYVDKFGSLAAKEQDSSREQAPPKAAPERRRKTLHSWWRDFTAALQEFAECFEGV